MLVKSRLACRDRRRHFRSDTSRLDLKENVGKVCLLDHTCFGAVGSGSASQGRAASRNVKMSKENKGKRATVLSWPPWLAELAGLANLAGRAELARLAGRGLAGLANGGGASATISVPKRNIS